MNMSQGIVGKPLLGAALFAASVAFLAGCGGDGGSALIVGNTRFQVIHADPGAGAIDVYADGVQIMQNADFGTFEYEGPSLPSTVIFQLTPTGGVTATAQADIALQADQLNTVAILPGANPGDPPQFVRVSAPVPQTFPTLGYFQLTHLATSAGTVDLYLSGDGDITDENPDVEDLQVGTGSLFQSVQPGTYQIILTAPNTKVAAFTQSVTLSAGDIKSGIVIDPATVGDPLPYRESTIIPN